MSAVNKFEINGQAVEIDDSKLKSDALLTQVSNLGKELLNGVVKYGIYISDDTGELKHADKVYRTILFEIKKQGRYYIKTDTNFMHPILAKYTDNSYSNLEMFIIDNNREIIKSILYLEKGYYAFTFNSQQEAPIFISVIDINNTVERHNNQYNINSIEIGRYLSIDGVITPGVARMRLIKMYITGGKYFISNTGTDYGTLSKFTSALYNEVETVYIKKSINKDYILDLKEGYYALSWDTDIISTIPTFVEIKWLEDYLHFNDIPINNRISIQQGMYINADGVIKSAIDDYFLAKFYIRKKSIYLIGENVYLSSGHAVIAKYKDKDFTIFEKFIIRYGLIPIDGQYELDEGYYAVCSNGGDNIYIKNVAEYNQICKSISKISNKEVGGINGFSKFYDANSTWQITNEEAISSAVGFDNSIIVSPRSYEDKFIMSCLFTPISVNEYGLFSFAIGKHSASSGTMIKISNENGNNAYVCRVDENENLIEVDNIDLSTLNIGLNKPIAVLMKKDYDSETYISVRFSDSYGNVVEKERMTSFIENESRWNVGLANGKIAIYAINGVVSAKRFEFGYPKTSDVQIAIMGHSFVEGNNSTVNDKDKRFSALLASDIGNDKCCIFGLGGGGIGMIDGLMEQVKWLNNLRYAVIMLGANDADNNPNAQKYGTFNTQLNNMGIKTIWLTITPLRDGTQAKPIIDSYIRNNFNYVDVSNAFYDENGDINVSLFSDNIHPSIEGYRKIYEIIKTQCSVLWTL